MLGTRELSWMCCKNPLYFECKLVHNASQKLICRGLDLKNLPLVLGQDDPRIPAGRYHDSSAVGDSMV